MPPKTNQIVNTAVSDLFFCHEKPGVWVEAEDGTGGSYDYQLLCEVAAGFLETLSGVAPGGLPTPEQLADNFLGRV